MELCFSTPVLPRVVSLRWGPRAKFVSVGSHAQGVAGASHGTSMTEHRFPHDDSNPESYNSTIQIHPRFSFAGMQEGS
jgi:hypothetical protein